MRLGCIVALAAMIVVSIADANEARADALPFTAADLSPVLVVINDESLPEACRFDHDQVRSEVHIRLLRAGFSVTENEGDSGSALVVTLFGEEREGRCFGANSVTIDTAIQLYQRGWDYFGGSVVKVNGFFAFNRPSSVPRNVLNNVDLLLEMTEFGEPPTGLGLRWPWQRQ
jgi:hypothetical protein